MKHVMLEHEMTLLKSKLVCLQSMPTRWTTAYTMIKRNNDLQDVLRVSISDARIQATGTHAKAQLNSVKNTLYDTVTFWPLSVCCEKILAPLRNAVKSAEGDLVRASAIPRIWNYVANTIKEVLSNDDCLIPQDEKTLITEAVIRRREFSVRDVQKAANILDPRFMGKDLTGAEQKQGLSLIVKVGSEFQLSSCQIMKDFMELKSHSGEVYGNPLIWEAVDIAMDPLNWWSAFCEGQPLQIVALKLLSLPASAAAVERSNKEYSLHKTKKRNRLSNTVSATVTKVAYNIKVQQSFKKRKKQVHTALQFSDGPVDMNLESSPTPDSQPPLKTRRCEPVAAESSSSDSESGDDMMIHDDDVQLTASEDEDGNNESDVDNDDDERQPEEPQVDDWVAVKLRGKKHSQVFLGCIRDIIPKIVVKFLKMSHRNYYIWPEQDDVSDVELGDFVKLSEPEKVGQSAYRSGGFSFDEDEVERAVSKLI